MAHATVISNAAILLKNSDNEILCVKLRNGNWTIPGGGVDPGERAWDVAVREFREETGNKLPDLRTEGQIFKSHDIVHSNGSITRIYIGKTTTPDLAIRTSDRKFNHETTDLQYFSYAEIYHRKIPFQDYALKSLQEIYSKDLLGGNKKIIYYKLNYIL